MWKCFLHRREKRNSSNYETNGHKRSAELKQPYIPELRSWELPLQKDIVIQQSHAIAWESHYVHLVCFLKFLTFQFTRRSTMLPVCFPTKVSALSLAAGTPLRCTSDTSPAKLHNKSRTGKRFGIYFWFTSRICSDSSFGVHTDPLCPRTEPNK